MVEKYGIFFLDPKKWIYPGARCARPRLQKSWKGKSACTPRALASLAPFFRKFLWYYKSMAFIRKFKTGSGKTGVQVCYKREGKVVRTVHVGSAETEEGIERLLRKAQGIIDEGKSPLFDLSDFDKK